MTDLFVLPLQRGSSSFLMMAAFTVEMRPDANHLDSGAREIDYTNQILSEKDTNIPTLSSLQLTAYSNSTGYPKSISAISIPIPDPNDNLDTSGSTLHMKETGQYGTSPYENLTSAILERDYGLVFESESNGYRPRERSYSVVQAAIGSVTTPNSRENTLYANAYPYLPEYTGDPVLSCSLTAFESLGPTFRPDAVTRQPVAELRKPELENNSCAVRQKKKSKPLNRSQSMSLDPSHWKTAVITSWYSFKHSIPTKHKAHFSDRPIWLMGEHYMDINPPIKHTCRQIGGKLDDSDMLPNHLVEFVRDFQTRIWITYRKNFAPLDGSVLTSDCGWGCMIRTGQMMLANGLMTHSMGRGWRLDTTDDKGMQEHNQILKWFLDVPGSEYPFSIHNLCRIGNVSGKKPGDWYGPSQVCFVLRDALCEAKHYHPEQFDNLQIYIARDCTIYKNEVAGLMNVNENCPQGDSQTGIIIYIPVRLGKESFNLEYAHCVKQFLALPFSLGMIGGRPKHSLYFLGFQGDSLICLDPHVSQTLVKNINREYHTYHCSTPKKLASSKLDPSSTIGFYCRNYPEFLDFCDQAYSILGTVKSQLYHMFSIMEKEENNRLSMSMPASHIVRLERKNSQKSNNSSSTTSHLVTEDFFQTPDFHPVDSDSIPEDDDYVVVSFT